MIEQIPVEFGLYRGLITVEALILVTGNVRSQQRPDLARLELAAVGLVVLGNWVVPIQPILERLVPIEIAGETAYVA